MSDDGSVAASIILIAVTVTVSIAVGAWMGAVSFQFPRPFTTTYEGLVIAVPSFGNATYAHAWVTSERGSQLANTVDPEPLPINLTVSTNSETGRLQVDYFVYVSINNYTYQLNKIGYQEFILNFTKLGEHKVG